MKALVSYLLAQFQRHRSAIFIKSTNKPVLSNHRLYFEDLPSVSMFVRISDIR